MPIAFLLSVDLIEFNGIQTDDKKGWTQANIAQVSPTIYGSSNKGKLGYTAAAAGDVKQSNERSQRVIKPVKNKVEGKRKRLSKVIVSSNSNPTRHHAQSGGHFRKYIVQKNNQKTAMESIIEEDETRCIVTQQRDHFPRSLPKEHIEDGIEHLMSEVHLLVEI